MPSRTLVVAATLSLTILELASQNPVAAFSICSSRVPKLCPAATTSTGHSRAFSTQFPIRQQQWYLQAESNPEEASKIAASASLPPSDNDDTNDAENETTSPPPPLLEAATPATTATTASVATMISQENKRILIEELGYRRADVERLKFELAPSIIEQRTKCPADGMPASWCRSEQELALERDAAMRNKLEQESKYPLKIPLIAISLILFGKGFGDALITIIKVNINFPGASLAEEFLGVPVLLIDGVCTILGAGLAWWTWNTMK